MAGTLPAAAEAGMPTAQLLVIGTHGVASKDLAVLKALVRLLDGGINLRARFSEDLHECNVVFVPGHSLPSSPLPARCVPVRVLAAEPEQGRVAGDDGALVVAAPLRLTNVIAVLQSAAQRVLGSGGMVQYDTVRSLSALFAVLRVGMPGPERRRAVVPMSSGQQVVFDFVNQRVHTALPMETLLSGAYTLGTPHRVSPVEEALIGSLPAHSLRHLLWGLAQRLAQAGAAAPERSGHYRLRRWPDAMALVAPGHPRLAALWTQRPLSLAQIDAASGVPPAAARWFLEACLALNLAQDEDPPAARAPTAPAPAAPGWLGQLRERLKLW